MRGGQRAQALQPLVQNPAQMARVAQAADGQAVQVHRLHKVAQQRPLEAEDVPPAGGRDGRKSGAVMVKRVEGGDKKNIYIYIFPTPSPPTKKRGNSNS